VLSIFLTHRFVSDPPSFSQKRSAARVNGKLRIDGTGIALIAIGSAALEILLDRGQIDDWFGSTFICWMFAVAVICLGTAIWWELRTPEPVIDLRLLKVRNFAIANLYYFVFGVGLFASTTLIPQILQSLYGYRAIDAGLVLGPGALVITFLAPVGAQLVQRDLIKPKNLLFCAILVAGLSFFHYSNFNLQTDSRHYALARAYQGLGYAFFFVPLSVIAYSQLAPNQNNKASSLTNFFRNWGGSFGIAFATALAERRQNFHQERVGSNLTASSSRLHSAIDATAAYLQGHGFSKADSMAAALARYYAELSVQTRFLAYMDCFRVLGWVTLLVSPLALWIVSTKVNSSEGAH
jgi:DHA2 family multidrug resistance protein